MFSGIAIIWKRNLGVVIQIKHSHCIVNSSPLLFTASSSPSEVFLGKGVLKTCSKFKGKIPFQKGIWNRTSAWVFSCKFAGYFQDTFFKEHLWRAASVQHKEEQNITSVRLCYWFRVYCKQLDIEFNLCRFS